MANKCNGITNYLKKYIEVLVKTTHGYYYYWATSSIAYNTTI